MSVLKAVPAGGGSLLCSCSPSNLWQIDLPRITDCKVFDLESGKNVSPNISQSKCFADTADAPLHSYKLCGPDPALEKQQIKALLKRSNPKKFLSPKRLSEFQKKSVRIRSVACESCLRALSPAGRGYGEKGLWSETNPRAGLASASLLSEPPNLRLGWTSSADPPSLSLSWSFV